MATPYEDIISLATITLQDWKLDNLFQQSPDAYIEYMSAFMIKNLFLFDNCRKDLTDVNQKEQEFNEDLDLMEQSIIANYTLLAWLQKEILDVNQMTGMLGNGVEASRYSEANLLKEKKAMYNDLSEAIDLQKNKYGIRHMETDAW